MNENELFLGRGHIFSPPFSTNLVPDNSQERLAEFGTIGTQEGF